MAAFLIFAATRSFSVTAALFVVHMLNINSVACLSAAKNLSRHIKLVERIR